MLPGIRVALVILVVLCLMSACGPSDAEIKALIDARVDTALADMEAEMNSAIVDATAEFDVWAERQVAILSDNADAVTARLDEQDEQINSQSAHINKSIRDLNAALERTSAEVREYITRELAAVR